MAHTIEDQPADSGVAGGRRAPPASPGVLPALILLAALTVALTHVAVFAVRLTSAARQGDVYALSGCEGPVIYSVWKARHGLPVYETYSRDCLTGTFYNHLFYQFYGLMLRSAGVAGARTVGAARLLTLGCGVAGVLLTWALMRRLAGASDDIRASVFLGAMAFVLWFGSSTMSWWVLIVRPDAAALALVVAGLMLSVRANARRSWPAALAASLVFYAAWAFKQSSVGILTGVSLYALWVGRNGNRPRIAAALVLPCVFLMGATLALGGTAYRFNLLTLPSSVALDPRIALNLFAGNILGNLFVWVVLAAALAVALRERVRDWWAGELGPIIFACVSSLAWGFFTTGRVGSNKNHLLEVSAAASVLSSVLLVRAAHRPGFLTPRLSVAAAALVLSMAALPAAQLVFFNRIGRVRLATTAEHAAKAALADTERRLPKPLFARDEMLALPWYSSEDRYPAYVLDMIVYDRPRLAELIATHHFRTLVLTGVDPMYLPALRAGYRPEPLPFSPLLAERILHWPGD